MTSSVNTDSGEDVNSFPEYAAFLPDISGLTRADAAHAYADAGIYIFPVNGKAPQLSDINEEGEVWSRSWKEFSSNDHTKINQWAKATWNPGGDHLPFRKGIGIDLGKSGMVAVDVDRPELVPDAWWPILEAAPFESSDSADERRGRYYFQQPEDRIGCPVAEWGEIKGMGGLVILAPSPHASAHLDWPGGQTKAGKHRATARIRQIRTGSLTPLPDLIADSFGEYREAQAAATAEEVAVFMEKFQGGAGEDPKLLGNIVRHFMNQITGDHSKGRHPTMVGCCVWAAKAAAAGLVSAELASDALRDVFIHGLSLGEDARPENPGEFTKMWEWAIAQVTDEGVHEYLTNRARKTIEWETARNADPQMSEPPEEDIWAGQTDMTNTFIGPEKGAPQAEEDGNQAKDRLPEVFWNSTAVLQQIHQMARARRASPDAVLHAVLARVAAMADPTVRADNGIQQPATLCWYCGLYGPSGSGKGNAEKTARELTPFPMIDFAVIGISTGQGIIAAYLEQETDPDDEGGKNKILVQRRTRGYALATEGSVIESMSRMAAASTLNTTLCSAWMSEWQGTSNATVELRRALPDGSYTLSMSLGVQEEPAAKLLEMGNIGLPQRLAWAHASLAPDTPRERPDTTGPLTLTMHNGQDAPVTTWVSTLRNVTMAVPPHVTEEIDTIILGNATEKPEGQPPNDPLDTHEPLWRLKCAALMALLHGHTEVRAQEWDMATVMWQTSRQVRGRVQTAADRRARAQRGAVRAEAVQTAVESQAAVYETIHGVHPSVENVAKRAHRYLTKHGGEIPARDVNRNCIKKPDRDQYKASGAEGSLWTAALQYGYEHGWLVILDGGLLSAGAVDPGDTKTT